MSLHSASATPSTSPGPLAGCDAPHSFQLLQPAPDRDNVYVWKGVAPSVAAFYTVTPVLGGRA